MGSDWEHTNRGSEKESYILTPGGRKNVRRPDITFENKKTGEKYDEQIGKADALGGPIKREREAIEDIHKATGVKPRLLHTTNSMASSLTLFCHPDELIKAIELIRERFDLDATVFARSQASASRIQSGEPLVLPERTYRVFLHHGRTVPLEISEMRSKERGWIDIVPGALATSSERPILTLTTFEAEGGEDAAMDGAKMVRRLKKQLKPTVKFGVSGVNEGEGRGHVYRDIGYTPGALALAESCVVWKREPGFRSVFQPAQEVSRSNVQRP